MFYSHRTHGAHRERYPLKQIKYTVAKFFLRDLCALCGKIINLIYIKLNCQKKSTH